MDPGIRIIVPYSQLSLDKIIFLSMDFIKCLDSNDNNHLLKSIVEYLHDIFYNENEFTVLNNVSEQQWTCFV